MSIRLTATMITRTMAAVRESADGSPGQAFLVVIAADAFLTLAVWVGFVALRAGDIHRR